MSASSLFAELKRRNVIRMAGLYLVGAWLITQVVDTIFPMFGAPDWLMRSIVIVLAIGFVPALVFAWVFAFTPDGFKLDSVVAAADSIGSRTAQRMNLAIVAVLLLALTYFGVDKFVFAPQREATLQLEAEKQGAARATERVAGNAVATIPAKSIAVLPLVNGSGDKDQQYFSDGLSEDLITALSQFEGLKVIGRNSAFQFRDSKDSSKVIGAKLGVAHLLEGSVRRAGDTVRITAQLVKAVDGSTLWSQHFDRPFKDLFALQDEITNAVASALKAELLAGPGATVQNDHPPGGNIDAYTAYLQGKFHRTRGTEADLRKAINAYTVATVLDPRYAQAYAMISHAWTDLGTQFLGGKAAQQAYAQARVAANTALQLSPGLAAVHVARGRLLSVADFDWAQAEAEYRRAVQLAPNDDGVKFSLGVLQATLGRPRQAADLTRQALATDPLHASWYYWLASYLVSTGNLDQAEQAITRAIELQSGAVAYYQQLAIIQIQRGDAEAALTAARQEPPGVWREIALALALQIGGDRAAADTDLQTLINTHDDIAAYQIADVYALRNDADKTFEWLDRAWANRDPGVAYLLYDPFLVRYRDDPRFATFARKVGLPVADSALPRPDAAH